MSYYNGLRLCAGESIDGELDETGYAIYLESNLRKDKDAKHLDIPTKVCSILIPPPPLEKYNAANFFC